MTTQVPRHSFLQSSTVDLSNYGCQLHTFDSLILSSNSCSLCVDRSTAESQERTEECSFHKEETWAVNHVCSEKSLSRNPKHINELWASDGLGKQHELDGGHLVSSWEGCCTVRSQEHLTPVLGQEAPPAACCVQSTELISLPTRAHKQGQGLQQGKLSPCSGAVCCNPASLPLKQFLLLFSICCQETKELS